MKYTTASYPFEEFQAHVAGVVQTMAETNPANKAGKKEGTAQAEVEKIMSKEHKRKLEHARETIKGMGDRLHMQHLYLLMAGLYLRKKLHLPQKEAFDKAEICARILRHLGEYGRDYEDAKLSVVSSDNAQGMFEPSLLKAAHQYFVGRNISTAFVPEAVPEIIRIARSYPEE